MNAEQSEGVERPRVLVAEDEVTQSFLIERLLRDRGFDVTVAGDGQEAWELLKASSFSAVVSDVNMPGLDGYDLCRAIRGDFRLRSLPVVLVTAMDEPVDLLKGLQARADFYLTKPLDPRHLLARLGTLVSGGARFDADPALPPIEFELGGDRVTVSASRRQIVNLLFSTYECVLQQNRDLTSIKLELNDRNRLLREQSDKILASEKNFRSLLEHHADGIVVTDLSGRVKFVNPAARGWLHVGAGDPMEHPFGFTIPAGSGCEVTLSGPDEPMLVVEMRSDESAWEGQPALLVSMRDITQRKLDEQKILEQQQQLQRANARLQALADTDGLTGLNNHRHFQDRLARFFEEGDSGRWISVVLMDVDAFKSFNDEFGHQAGDEVLRELGRILQATVRDSDVVARYGGEEFVAILPDTDRSRAVAAAERMRRAILSASWKYRPITASFGVSTRTRGGGNPQALVNEADQALYFSKQSGRNRVTHALMVERAKMHA